MGTLMSLRTDFKAASAGRQIAIIAGGVALLGVILFSFYFAVLRTSYSVLFADLRPVDAAAIVTALDTKKVPYRLEDGGRRILVPADQADATRLTVMGGGVPTTGAIGFELFNKSDMGLTEFAQKINYQRALQGELARTIMTLDTVDTARVHLALGEATLFRDDRRPATASVAITTHGGVRLAPSTVRGIQRLVAAAVPNLESGNVTVLDGHGRVVTAAGDDASEASVAGREARALEQYYSLRIAAALDAALPSTAIKVDVRAIPQAPPASRRDVGAPSQLLSNADGQEEGRAPARLVERNVGLHIDLASRLPLDQRTINTARDIATQTIGFDQALGDDVAFALLPRVETGDDVTPDRPTQLVPADLTPSVREPATDFWLIAALVILAGLVAMLLALGGRRSKSRLSVLERDDYVRQFRELLGEGATDVRAAP